MRLGLMAALIVLQRRRVAEPALRVLLTDAEFLQDARLDALLKVIGEVHCFDLPDACPWTLGQALEHGFLLADYLPS